MPVVIPCAPDGQSNWRQRTAIDGRDYILSFTWVQRDGHWYMDLADQDGVAISSGIKLVPTWPLLRGITDARRPPGQMILEDTTGGLAEPAFGELGTKYQLVYLAPDEL